MPIAPQADSPSSDVLTASFLPPPTLHPVLSRRLSLADFQNAVPLLRELVVRNPAAESLHALDLSIEAEPPFLRPRRWHIDAIAPEGEAHLGDLDLALDGALLARLIETEPATVRLRLRGKHGGTLASLDTTLDVLPRNHWGGLTQLPDLLAAFVQPNSSGIERLLRRAADLLRAQGRRDALDGYTDGPARAWELASALWSATAALGLGYALPPASFEHAGQKVRSPAQLLDGGLGTCLDLALMFAAAIEQMGLNPLVIVTRGHAFAGLWLRPHTFESVVTDDPSALRKRLHLGEIALFETTLVTHAPAPGFARACERGAHQLSEADDDGFELAIDIRRARQQRIRPLAEAVMGRPARPIGTGDAPDPAALSLPDGARAPGGAATVPGADAASDTAAPGGTAPAFDPAPDFPDLPPDSDAGALSPADRLARWQRKLLDLSLSNNLLNFRPGRRAVALHAPDAAALEDLLAAGTPLRLVARPALMAGVDPRSLELHEQRHAGRLHAELAREALARHELLVDDSPARLDASLVRLHRAARAAWQESGANTLFLALGFLNWMPARADGRPGSRCLRAPLVLLPVALERRNARSPFRLRMLDDEPRFNPTLVELLRQDFGLALPGLDGGELPRDHSGLDIAGIWRRVSRAVRDFAGWEVSEDVVLAGFSFAKHLMWKDLVEQTGRLRENRVVRHLIDSPRAPWPAGEPFPEPRRLDADFPPERVCCPLPADSTQLAAVLAAGCGKDFVLIGPPGTGKSQTIANLIAQCLADGKRVLFVAEKMAALDVVHRRLREVGLGEFCLELHSSKARVREVLARLRAAWDLADDGGGVGVGDATQAARRDLTGAASGDAGHGRPEATAAGQLATARDTEAARLGKLRAGLDALVERLHACHANGLSVRSAIGLVLDHATRAATPAGPTAPPGHTTTPPLAPAGSAGSAPPLPALAWPDRDPHDADAMLELRDAVDALAVTAGAVSPCGHPLAVIGARDWSPAWQQALLDASRALGEAAAGAGRALRRFCAITGLPRPAGRQGAVALALLARLLPRAAGHDWRFMLRADAEALARRLAEGHALLARHRAYGARLSEPWPDAVLQDAHRGLDLLRRERAARAALPEPLPASVAALLERGLEVLDEIATVKAGLAARYGADAARLDIARLNAQWAALPRMVWPLSALRRLRIARLLAAVAVEGRPDPAADLPRLAQLDELHARFATIDPGPHARDFWHGEGADPLRAMLCLDAALAAARAGEAWTDEGLDPVAVGTCGAAAQDQFARLLALREAQTGLAALAPLDAATGGLWQGHATDEARLDAALRFQLALRKLRAIGRGAPGDEHVAIARGDAGPAMAADLATLRKRAAVEARITALADLGRLSGGLWRGLDTSADELRAALGFHQMLAGILARLAPTPRDRAVWLKPLARLLIGDRARLAPDAEPMRVGESLALALQALPGAIAVHAEVAGLDPGRRAALDRADLDALARHAAGLLAAGPRLKAWCAWRRARDHAAALGLGPIVAALEAGTLAPTDARAVFEAAYARWWLDAVVEHEPLLRDFLGPVHEQRIADFRAADRRLADLTRDWLRARLRAGLPAPDSPALDADWTLLRRELAGRPNLTLRQLMARAPGALARLAPCMLMSPLSIAQFLPPEAPPFDLVVFDEASQIAVWDAIGAMARGRQVVMVGDPKQLPPTGFFGRAEADGGFDGGGPSGHGPVADGSDAAPPDADVFVADPDSILDECLGANLPARRLGWHYRSRSESLIAFANHRYYDGALVTLPAPVTDDRAVSFHAVADGCYERGGSRTNPAEARALVAELVARLRAPGFAQAGLSVGVVTFNAEQMALIEDLLDEARRADPALEAFFADGAREPVFVKNLESVQGDERDLMYFSITYGPDRDGRLSMNFGPMNRAGGERRLNVAITRARLELHVFSSLRASQMDPARLRAEGARDLRRFLDFAERGTVALELAGTPTTREPETDRLARAVARALAARGWVLDGPVGASAFRVELAVVDPDDPARYLAALECDGDTCRRAATARDRDLLREQLLRDLGWDVLRLWSVDWWSDADGACERLDARLRELLAATRDRRATAEAANVAAVAQTARAVLARAAGTADTAESVDAAEPDTMAETTGTPAPDDAVGPTAATQTADAQVLSRAPAMADTAPDAHADAAPAAEPPRLLADFAGADDDTLALLTETDPAPADLDARDEIPTLDTPIADDATAPLFAPYRVADPATVARPDAEAFHSPAYDHVLAGMVLHVVAVEAPVGAELLVERIARAHGFARSGRLIRERVLGFARRLCRVTVEGEADAPAEVFWRIDADPAVAPVFRTPVPEAPRGLADICDAELAALARAVLAAGAEGDAALGRMARQIGLRRLVSASRARLAAALDAARG
ncbi:DUF3320 domain-containing protein [Derxia gummosa]|uniref:DUF3320 domain-containing protein n=1 Tax=Derxia gummosa DSM 723 TaxID=1121388 RepID=A0A8B6X9S1_9BURK|nr:DUF3320 domain-containing protein [Derxia gummosa]